MDILYLVDRLENLVANSKKMPLMNQIMLRDADILTIIDQMRTAIPNEIKQARRIIQEKERIIAQAQSDATMILARAREEAERELNREGLMRTAEERSQSIVHQANEQAKIIRQQAEKQTEQLQIEADSYAHETLNNLREQLLSVSMTIERTVMSIERGIESLEGQPEEANNVQEIAAKETIEAPSTPEIPRRASLAADTMGTPFYPQDHH
ncbi:MAG TPA: hypothetical protein VL461_01055 [Dictyobacter sp.]|jgi:hypothetical protein|nr:hypothetical protein [Dictyobacter sp.]